MSHGNVITHTGTCNEWSCLWCEAAQADGDQGIELEDCKVT